MTHYEMFKACLECHNMEYEEAVGKNFISMVIPMVTDPNGTYKVLMYHNFVKSTGKLLSVRYEECE